MNLARRLLFHLARQGYNVVIHLLIPAALLHFLWRARREPAYGQHIGERLCRGPAPAPAPDFWIHAVSLGEMRVAGTLIEALVQQHPDLRIQLTTVTPAGRAEGGRLQAGGLPVDVRYLPLDSPLLVRRFIRQLRPRALVLIETELWPNLLWECRRSGLPAMLANARLSPRLRDTYRRFRALYGPLLAGLDWVAAQSPADAAHFRALGATRVEVAGNLKFDAAPGSARTDLVRSHFLGERLWVAGSTHPGEETRLIEIHHRLCERYPHSLIQLLLAPRHPARAESIVAEVKEAGLSAVARSQMDPSGTAADVIVLDTLGELAALYALGDAAFVGGSLVDHGGQNPLEPIAAGCPVILGPDTRNFADMVALLVEAGAVLQVADADALFAALNGLLVDREPARELARHAQETVGIHRGATERTLALLSPQLRPD
ncbi:3-deoxy-D-manno-octulosonic acid transferase [Thioalkalivibrio paradoxus]|uniref:3-deoxy-D-manno-octulosonic acid transferase n=1 Tax=Thioalkalivibrio paradoxus TaxID=108010 RepID=UPI00022C1AD8|nr:3-deoxy-D-manno-octulosonic acid transferase [Thioalkalivibrio paradoxus]